MSLWIVVLVAVLVAGTIGAVAFVRFNRAILAVENGSRKRIEATNDQGSTPGATREPASAPIGIRAFGIEAGRTAELRTENGQPIDANNVKAGRDVKLVIASGPEKKTVVTPRPSPERTSLTKTSAGRDVSFVTNYYGGLPRDSLADGKTLARGRGRKAAVVIVISIALVAFFSVIVVVLVSKAGKCMTRFRCDDCPITVERGYVAYYREDGGMMVAILGDGASFSRRLRGAGFEIGCTGGVIEISGRAADGSTFYYSATIPSTRESAVLRFSINDFRQTEHSQLANANDLNEVTTTLKSTELNYPGPQAEYNNSTTTGPNTRVVGFDSQPDGDTHGNTELLNDEPKASHNQPQKKGFLIWHLSDKSHASSVDAAKHCEQLYSDYRNDWRLPTERECKQRPRSLRRRYNWTSIGELSRVVSTWCRSDPHHRIRTLCVRDTENGGLSWHVSHRHHTDNDDAKLYCERLTRRGYDDWRLPDSNAELRRRPSSQDGKCNWSSSQLGLLPVGDSSDYLYCNKTPKIATICVRREPPAL